MSRTVPGVMLFVLAVAGGACSHSTQQAGSEQRRLVLTGSSTIAPLALEIGKRFESIHESVRVDVQTGGSSRGIADATRGTADIGMASRTLRESETGLVVYQIAWDGIGIIVNAANPVSSLSNQQVIDIYTGAINRWKEVGGNDAPILVVNKAEGRGTLEVFLHYFKLENEAIQADVVIGDNEQGIKTVAGNVGAIGYVSIGTAEYDVGHGVAVKILPADGVPASTKTLAKGSYPIARPLNLLTRGEATGLAREFIDYCRSEAVHDLIEAQYFVPLAR